MDGHVSVHQRKWEHYLQSSVAVVLGGVVPSIVVYLGLTIVSTPVTFGFDLNATTAAVYGITISITSIVYTINRGLVSTYLLSAAVWTAAFYYDVVYHTEGVLSPPVNLALQQSLPTAFVCLGFAVAIITLVERTK